MSRANVTRWGEGRIPSNSTKLLIANYFKVPVSELDDEEEKLINIEGDNSMNLSLEEQRLIQKWREVGDEGKIVVESVLDRYSKQRSKEGQVM
jgi:transcriptional regulator with XRE-family HTH domain